MALPSKTRLGPYEIQQPLGAGGMGEVYRARDMRLDRSVAVKVLAPEIAADSAARSRFEREARAVAALDHPHICAIYDAGEAGGTQYLVMPLLEGQTLAARLERGPLPLDQALTIAAQVADALDKAHRQGILHRDLKPANIMLTRTGAKLLDFGLAKLRVQTGALSMSTVGVGGTTSTPQTAEGTIVGTLHYMAPEQVEGKEADARSDIWALGVVLYEMVTGVRPFSGTTPASVIGAILKDEAPSVASRQPLTPAAVDHLVAGCLVKEPDERWQSAGDLRRQLKWIAQVDRSNAPAAIKAGRRSPVLLTGSLVLAGVIALLSGWAWRPRPPVETSAQAPPVVFTIAPPAGLTLAARVASTSVPQVAVSPDGRYVAFGAANQQGQSRLWVRALDEAAPRPLLGTDGALDPFWSPDSRRLAFIAEGVLKIIDVMSDAAPVRVVAAATVDPRGAAWSAPGVLFYTGSTIDLSLVSADGGPPTSIPLGTPIGPARWPEFLPGGRELLLQVRSPDPARRGIYLRSLDNPTAEPRRLVGSDYGARYGSGHLLFLEGTTLMAQPLDAPTGVLSGAPTPVARGVGGSSNGYSAFSVSNTGVLAYAGPAALNSELRWVDRSGRAAELVGPDADYVDFRLSHDQLRLAYARVDPHTGFPDVFILDFARGTTTRLTGERLTEASPVWSPDDRQLAFRSNRGTTSGNDLYLTTAAPGGAVTDLYGGGATGTIIPSFWMADGRLVFYQIAPGTVANGYGLWMVDVARHEAKAILDTPANELQAALSPNGRWMAYTSDRSGRYEIYVMDFETGTTLEQVSSDGGVQPQWRADGRELFYLRADGALMTVAVGPGERFTTAAARQLFQTALPSVLNPFRMDYVPAADGQRFLMKVPVESTPRAEITVVLNWPARLRQ